MKEKNEGHMVLWAELVFRKKMEEDVGGSKSKQRIKNESLRKFLVQSVMRKKIVILSSIANGGMVIRVLGDTNNNGKEYLYLQMKLISDMLDEKHSRNILRSSTDKHVSMSVKVIGPNYVCNVSIFQPLTQSD